MFETWKVKIITHDLKPWFNILLHTQSIVCATVDSQYILGIYNFATRLKTPQPVLPYWGPLPVEVLPAKNSQFFFFFTKLLALCAFYSEGQLLNGKITLLYGGNTYRVSSHIFTPTPWLIRIRFTRISLQKFLH